MIARLVQAVRDYLAMPSQADFDAIIAEGFEAEEARYAAWVADQVTA